MVSAEVSCCSCDVKIIEPGVVLGDLKEFFVLREERLFWIIEKSEAELGKKEKTVRKMCCKH